ncbi:xanthine dehydrogenase family protein molybdopterin-binding subunit [Shewanella mesophila]|uniref:xanthine dehydrogenase family protein molybdopterin-binding subunit n=1 Tax=Shewanella mesophila TaxID=2864208 RepID=UPI001C6599D0|nr:xanthine dehydrogenase family protein molybdopterin-binding subunit [Shewanella mesophila]QYJ84753.1 xanthine dehydrogenase family protein molybdopterin-binding subunit [Shewanella mesophila]
MSTFTAVQNFSRRDVLKLFGAAGGGLALGASGLSWSPMAIAQQEESRLNLFVAIGEDNKVYLTCHRSEMGQGIRTGIPQVLADELGASWENVVVIQGLADKRYGSQNTDGSRSIRRGFDKMREMGAMARTMLEQAASERLKVPLNELKTSDNKVIHSSSGRSITFGELAMAAAKLPLPDAATLKLKSPKAFTHIGKSHRIVDMDDILTGSAQYGYDVRLEGMLYASISRPAVLGSQLTQLDDADARKVAGVVDVITLPVPKGAPSFQPLGGVAVVASNSWSAIEGRKKLITQWSASDNDTHDSKVYLKALMTRVQAPGKLVRQQGDENHDWPEKDTISAVYTVPYLAHAMMEPPTATARMTQEGVEIWASTQTPQSAQQTVAAALGLKEEQVIVHVTLLGGGFGRKSKPDFCVEAALLAKHTGKPVKVSWSREDELQNGYLHAISAQYFRAKVSSSSVEAILQRTGFPSISSTFNTSVDEPSASELDLGFVDVPLAVNSLRCESVKASAHTRIGWMRSVCNIQHGFGIGSFVDELAQKRQLPTLQMWRELLGEDRQETFAEQGFKYGNYGEDLSRHPVDVARFIGVIDAIEKAMLKQPKPSKGQGWGFAVHRSFTAFVATATLVEVKDEQLKVLKSVIAIDAGTLVNPDRVRSQLEGAVMFGLSIALMGEISFKDGRVEQSNFHDYPLLRMSQCPEIETLIVASDAAPAGVGEPGVPPIAPSLVNAIFAATGLRIRELPINKLLSI